MTEIIAHRGASYDAPENSLEAIELAIAQGAERIEVDLHVTTDGRVVVHHDPVTTRCTDRDIEIAASTFGEVRVARLANGEPIPSLEELIECTKGRVELDLEIKAPSRACVEATLKATDDAGITQDVLFTSFDQAVITWLGDGNTRRRGLLIGSASIDPWQRAYEAWPLRVMNRIGATDLAIHQLLVHPFLPPALRKQGMGLWLWFAMEDERYEDYHRQRLYERALSHNPDGIIVGRVAEFREIKTDYFPEQ